MGAMPSREAYGVRDTARLAGRMRPGEITVCEALDAITGETELPDTVEMRNNENITSRPAMPVPLPRGAGGLPIGMRLAGKVVEAARFPRPARQPGKAAPRIMRCPPNPPRQPAFAVAGRPACTG